MVAILISIRMGPYNYLLEVDDFPSVFNLLFDHLGSYLKDMQAKLIRFLPNV